MILPTSLPLTCANSSSTSTVPFERAAICSTLLTVALALWERVAPLWVGCDHAEVARRGAVVFPEDERPEKLIPQLSRPAREMSGPANAAMTPSSQCWQSETSATAPTASFQPASAPPWAADTDRRLPT